MFVASSAALLDRLITSACAMISPPLENVLHRVFTHATLCDLRFLQTAGFIAGVVNPMFKDKSDWWDLLCDVETGLASLGLTD